MRKVVFVTNIPAHYRAALIRAASKNLLDKEIDLITIFSRVSYSKRDYWNIKKENLDFNYRILDRKNSILIKDKLLEIGIDTVKEIKKISPELIIFVGFSIQSFLLARYCIKNKIPYFLYSGETKYTAKKYKYNFLRKIQRNYIVKNADGFLVYGASAYEYIKEFKRKSDNINTVINTIDTNSFISRLKEIPETQNGICRILYVGDLIKRKGVEYLLQAYASMNPESREKSSLVICGGGEERNNLEEFVKKNNLTNVKFTGKINYSETAKYFKSCDVFVLASINELFGLVLVEAACAGKPLIGSIYAGGSFDLISENQNGYIVNPYDVKDFGLKLERLVTDDKLRKEFGRNSLKVINEKVNIEIAAKSFSDSVINQLNAEKK